MKRLGKKIYVDRLGQIRGENRIKSKCRVTRTYIFWFIVFSIVGGLVLHSLTFFTSLLPYAGLKWTAVVIVNLLIFSFLAYVVRVWKKQLTKPVKPVTVYENGISFTDWHVKYGLKDIIYYPALKFDEIEGVKEKPHAKANDLYHIYIYTKDGDHFLLQHFLSSDHEEFFQILEEKGIPVKRGTGPRRDS